MISRWVGRAPVVVFTVLAYALSWWPALLPGGGLLPHGPAVAAGVVIGVTTGRAGLRRWVGSMVAAGRGVRWYAGAALVPAVLALGAAGATVVAGAPVPGAVDWRDPVRVLPLMLVVGGMWEEPGWTGYALPRLLERFGTAPAGILVATAVTGAVRAGWHLPLVLSGALLWVELAFIVALQVVLSWMFLGSTSLLPVMLAHLVSNSAGGAFVETWFGDGDRVVNAVARAVLWSLFALVLVVGTRARLGHDGPPGTSGAWGTSRGGGVPG